MISTAIGITIFAIAFFSPENLITTIVGFLVSMGLTQWLKNRTDLYGTAAALLAFVVSFVVAIVAVVAATFFSGGEITWTTIPQAGLQIFALATMAYKLMLADKE